MYVDRENAGPMLTNKQYKKIDSPCVRKCHLRDGTCIGCGRTVDEITRWSSMTQAERDQVNDRLASELRTSQT